MDGFDASLAEGVMLLTPFNADATDEATVNFVTKYQELYGETPNQFAADAYDCVYAYKMALEAAGCTPDMSNEELCDALIATFPTITLTGLTGDGAGITWDASGEVSKSPKGMVIENGAYAVSYTHPCQLSREELRRRRAESVRNVKATNGRVSLEGRAREVWEEGDEWLD